MKSIAIVGIGMNRNTLTQEGLATIQNAELLLGAPRLTDLFVDLGKPVCPEYLPDGVLDALEKSDAKRFAVLVSGDVGFYSAASGLTDALTSYDVRLIPSISSLSYLFAKLKRPWQETAIVSCHGRESNLVDAVRRNKLTFALTGGNVAMLAEQLMCAGFGDLTATVGANLGAAEERITAMPVSALIAEPIAPLTVLLIENADYDARVRFGLPDEAFVRGDVPMTKAAVRAVTLSKLALAPDAVCCDVGCGTGSVSVEMALAAFNGTVYAVDHNAEAIRLTEENSKRFHIGNILPQCGEAVEVLSELPPLDAAFIGGSSGQMREIFAAILSKNPTARIVVNAIALESVHAALTAFQAHGIEPEIVQLSVAKAKCAGSLHMLNAQNPVFIISGGGHA